jgi:hypothetical protein
MSDKDKKRKTIHKSVSLTEQILINSKEGYATSYETVHRTVSPKFANEFGASCRWFEKL